MSKSLLQSDILEAKYGTINAEVIKHNKYTREVFLLDEKGVRREYAITFFSKSLGKNLVTINNKIKRGGLIGKTFRDARYHIIKRNRKSFSIVLPAWLKKEFSTNKKSAKSSVYEFCVKRGSGPLQLYGTIFEVYNPK